MFMKINTPSKKKYSLIFHSPQSIFNFETESRGELTSRFHKKVESVLQEYENYFNFVVSEDKQEDFEQALEEAGYEFKVTLKHSKVIHYRIKLGNEYDELNHF